MVVIGLRGLVAQRVNLVKVALLLVLSNSCMAAQAAAPDQGGMMNQMIFLAVIFGVFYFMLIRPQSKRAKEHKDLLAGINNGDEVVTTSGIFGKISKVEDGCFVLTVADGVDIRVQKQSVAAALPKGSLNLKCTQNR